MRPEIQESGTLRQAPHQRFLPGRELDAESSGLYAGEPEACRRELSQFLPILAHFGLLLAVFRVYLLEGRAFQILMPIALVALPIHYALSYRWKKPFLLGVSIVGLGWVFGLATIAAVLTLSAVLIAICYAPMAWKYRAGAVAALTLAMALARNHSAALGIPDSVWPVLASMFMFRIILFLYELKHAKKPESLIDALSYFFLLPNACFVLFPVVDYRTLQRGYFARSIHAIQRRGLQMMFQGTIHLLLYRLIYFKAPTRPDSVHGLGSLVLYLVCNYLLYLHVSGQFHIACGLLHLFGFELPETHHHYLLATGFTDYWRRINIYWKDFMIRVVFNPVVFKLKRWPQPAALALATAIVFLATWVLHAYQWFWLCGSWNFSVPDALFWGTLGALVLVNVQFDARRPRKVRNEARSARQIAVRVIKTAGTFTTIALLWSLWSSPTVSAWLEMLRRGLKL
jgi:D-alanyl-lipoteichoic acid acyltransferase DltB (MBOAT superfamily)